MRRIANTRIAALAAALVAGVLAAYAMRTGSPNGGLVARVQTPPAQVRTQVIRRTIHVVRHERPPRGNAVHGVSTVGGASRALGASAAPRSATSGSHLAGAAAPVGAASPRTRTSGSVSGSAAPGSGRSGSAPVRTHTSGAASGGSTSSGGAVRTATSGRGGEHEGGHDD